MIRLFLIALSAATILGCASAFEKPEQNAYYGDVPTNIDQKVKDHFALTLKDPTSPIYRIGKPRKAYVNGGLLVNGGKVSFTGYSVPVMVNAKNSFGGYVGFKPYTVLFKNNEVVDHIKGHSHILLHEVGPPVDTSSLSEDAGQHESTEPDRKIGTQEFQAQVTAREYNCSPSVQLISQHQGKELFSSECASGRTLVISCLWRQCEVVD